MYGASTVLQVLDHTGRHCCKNPSEKRQQGFIIIEMRSYLLKEQLQMQSTETSFCIFLWSNNQVLPKFYYLLIFSPLIKWNSTHCHLIYLMELFKGKENFKKVDSNNNWKTAWPRMILEWHLFLRLSLGFVKKKKKEKKKLSFVGKRLTFYSKIFMYFLFKWRGVKPTNMSNKICRAWKSGRSKNIIQLEKDNF